MTTKLKTLISINIVLLLAIAGSAFIGQQKQDLSSEKQSFFNLSELNSINKIVSGRNTLERQPTGNWQLNGKEGIAFDKIRTLLTVMNRMEVKREISPSFQAEVQQKINTKGIPVQVYSNDILIREFTVYAENESEALIQRKDQPPYAVYIPGYFINIKDIFAVNNDWLDKRLLKTTWKTMRQLQVMYAGQMKANGFQISYNEQNQFYQVSNISKLDTAMLYQYVSSLGRLKYLSKSNSPSLRDSLKQFRPFSKVNLEDQNKAYNISFEVYPLEKEVFVWDKEKDNIFEVNQKAMQDILVTPQLFDATVKKPNQRRR